MMYHIEYDMRNKHWVYNFADAHCAFEFLASAIMNDKVTNISARVQ